MNAKLKKPSKKASPRQNGAVKHRTVSIDLKERGLHVESEFSKPLIVRIPKNLTYHLPRFQVVSEQ